MAQNSPWRIVTPIQIPQAVHTIYHSGNCTIEKDDLAQTGNDQNQTGLAVQIHLIRASKPANNIREFTDQSSILNRSHYRSPIAKYRYRTFPYTIAPWGGGGVTRNIAGTHGHACPKNIEKGSLFLPNKASTTSLRKRVVFQSNIQRFEKKGCFFSLTFDVFEKEGYSIL